MSDGILRCCGDCKHFDPSRRSKDGMGSCKVDGQGARSRVTDTIDSEGVHVVRTHWQLPLWPRVRRYCEDFEAMPI